MVPRHKAIALTIALLGLGYVGAGISYSHLLGLEIDFPYLCPGCPEIFSLGPPLTKFVSRTLVFGTINAVLLTAVVWGLIALATGIEYLFRDSHRK